MSRPLICDLCGTVIAEHPTSFTQYVELERHGAMAVDLHADVRYDLCVKCFTRIFEKGSDPDETE